MKKITFNNEEFNRRIEKIFWLFIYVLVYMLITIGFALILQLKNPFSLNYMQLTTFGDWVALGINISSCVLGGLFLYHYARHGRIKRLDFWLGQLGMLILVNGILFFSIQTSMVQYQRLTKSNVESIIKMVSSNYIVSYVVLSLSMIFMLYLCLKKNWASKNNWYVFATLAPYIVEMGFILRYQRSWINFTHMREFSYTNIYELLLNYHRYAKPISLLLLDDSSTPVGIVMVIGLALLIYIGGEYLVWKVHQAIESRKEKAERK